jgi:hypothetical protein
VIANKIPALRQLAGGVRLDSVIRNPGSTQARQRLVSASLEYLGLHPGRDRSGEEIGDFVRVAGAQGFPRSSISATLPGR